MVRWTGCVLVSLLVLAPSVWAQTGEAELETQLTPRRVAVSLEENQTLELRIDARLQCTPGLDAPGDLRGFFSRHGFGNTPVYWSLEPTRIRVPWQEEDNGLWVIDETLGFKLHADTPAPEHIAGEEESLLYINGGRSFSPRSCTPAGHAWDAQEHPLTVIVPVGTAEDDGPVIQRSGPENPFVTPGKATVVFLLVVFVAYLRNRWDRHRGS